MWWHTVDGSEIGRSPGWGEGILSHYLILFTGFDTSQNSAGFQLIDSIWEWKLMELGAISNPARWAIPWWVTWSTRVWWPTEGIWWNMLTTACTGAGNLGPNKSLTKAVCFGDTGQMLQKSGDHQLIWRIYHYVQGFIHVRIFSINRKSKKALKIDMAQKWKRLRLAWTDWMHISSIFALSVPQRWYFYRLLRFTYVTAVWLNQNDFEGANHQVGSIFSIELDVNYIHWHLVLWCTLLEEDGKK